MQLIINKVKFAIIISFFVISQIDCRMLDVWIGADTSERHDSRANPVTIFFEVGLCIKTYPIISTNQLVYNMLKRNLSGEVTISFDDFDVYKSIDDAFYLFIPHSYKTKIVSSLPKQFNENLKKYKEGKELISKKTDKEFIKYHQNIIKTLKQYTQEEIAIGFSIDPSSNVLQKVEKKNLQSADYIENIRRGPVVNFVDSIKKLFVVGKGDFFGLWNIILEGHGGYPKNVKMNLTMASIVNQLGEDAGMMIAGLSLPRFRDFIQFITNDIATNFFYYMTCYSGDLNMILPYITTLLNIRAGLENVKIFGKEQNKLIKESIISLKKPNFTIANGSLTSHIGIVSGEHSMIQCKRLYDPKSTGIDKELAQVYVDASKFFNLLNKYSKDKAGNEAAIAVKFNNEELKDILSAITPFYGGYFSNPAYFKTLSKKELAEVDPYGISGLPSVMFPGTEKFVAIALDDETVVLSNVLVEKYKKENKSFNLNDKKAILIYPKEISPEIIINKKNLPLYPSIVSMIPGLSLHKIDNLKIEVSSSDKVNEILDTFIKDSFTKIKPASPKYFYIKKLSIIKDGIEIVQDDVFIRSQQDKDYLYINTIDSPIAGSINVGRSKPGKTVLENKIKVEAVPKNSFLNSIYNYFILNPKIGEEFKFDDIKLLLTKEELDILNQFVKKDIKKQGKTQAQKIAAMQAAAKAKAKIANAAAKVKAKKPTAMKAKSTNAVDKTKAQKVEVMKAAAIKEKALAVAKAKAASVAKIKAKIVSAADKAKIQKAAAMKAKAIREKILAAAKAKAAKAKAQKAAAMKAKAIREKILASAKAKVAKAKAQKAKAAKKK